MKTYDLIAIGTGSAMNIVEAVLQRTPDLKVAVIDKDDPGGICLTRGCIPTKILLYPAELVRLTAGAEQFGIRTTVENIDFAGIMARMRTMIGRDVEEIRAGLSAAAELTYCPEQTEFIAPYQLRVGKEILTAPMIFLCTGSRPRIPPVDGLSECPYWTSDTILGMRERPARLAILGGGYIAAEYGHFFSAMGSQVTILGRNPRFLPGEEPEVSALAQREMSRWTEILTDHEVLGVRPGKDGGQVVVARQGASGQEREVAADAVLVAVGRSSNADLLHPERAGIAIDEKGWIAVDEFLETSQPGVWALGDANGRHLFKHVANYESRVVYLSAVLEERTRVDYHAVPHAVFSHPEIASVGLRQREAVAVHGGDGVLVGFQRFRNTAKGEAMGLGDEFVKLLVAAEGGRILGAHVIGPQASLLIQEIITLMYTPEQSLHPISRGMHIHPALSEVVERAAQSLMPAARYDALLQSGRLG